MTETDNDEKFLTTHIIEESRVKCKFPLVVAKTKNNVYTLKEVHFNVEPEPTLSTIQNIITIAPGIYMYERHNSSTKVHYLVNEHDNTMYRFSPDEFIMIFVKKQRICIFNNFNANIATFHIPQQHMNFEGSKLYLELRDKYRITKCVKPVYLINHARWWCDMDCRRAGGSGLGVVEIIGLNKTRRENEIGAFCYLGDPCDHNGYITVESRYIRNKSIIEYYCYPWLSKTHDNSEISMQFVIEPKPYNTVREKTYVRENTPLYTTYKLTRKNYSICKLLYDCSCTFK